MNKISGKIVLKESGIGIPDLLVSIIDIDPKTQPEEIIASFVDGNNAPIAATGQGFPGDRIGSVLTNTNGTFELAYEDDEFKIRNENEKRPDLFLIVQAPEESGRDFKSRILFTSIAFRQNAGRTEQFLIWLTTEQLKNADIPLPTIPIQELEKSKNIVARLGDSELRDEQITEGLREIAKKRVENKRSVRKRFDAKFKPALHDALSRLPKNLLDPDRVVRSGESVEEKSFRNIKRNIEEVVNRPDQRASLTGFLTLTDKQKGAIKKQLDIGCTISAEDLEKVIGSDRSRTQSSSFFLREDPLAQICRERTQTETECANLLLERQDGNNVDAPEGNTPPVDSNRTGTGVETVTEQDITRYIARVMDTLTSPEEQVVTGLTPRADRAIVQQNIKKLSFERSPAEVPAFHDFHSLQIAFEHVWQEAIDRGILDVSADIYETIVELGGDPDRAMDEDNEKRPPWIAALNEGNFVLKVHQSELMKSQWSTEINSTQEGNDLHRGDIEATYRDGRYPHNHTQHHLSRLPGLLAELEKRLQENYAFTIYAANNKERSINFGLLITYRQIWLLENYQAGELVQTIPLAPKETRKFSKKTVINRKRSEKEVEHHLMSRREEVSRTTRAEEEITRKAFVKTNFTHSTKESLSVPVGDATIGGDTTNSFKIDAGKESSDVKKSFHEAVFKAAQEFKQERTTEISTEVSEESEFIESGEITNPNDEIAVTFMFYELQRRYRVTETIHQLTPVIFVAQEVPEPQDIDEAWLVGHDWILRRVILDDSFLPALNYLSQDVVGDEAALGELRKNVDQQRRIVDQLRQELSAVRDRATVQRALLERGIYQKAGVVKDHRTSNGGGGLFDSFEDAANSLVDTASAAVSAAAGAVGDLVFGGGSSGQGLFDALKGTADQAADEARDLLFRLEREVTALNELTEKYTKELGAHLNRRMQVALHVKDNILYYMQAIWLHEPPDQRFFRLHNVKVPVLKAKKRRFEINLTAPQPGVLASKVHWRLTPDHTPPPPAKVYPLKAQWEIDPDLKFAPLVQVADLDNLQGFKGNYMIFPLKESNALTDFMMRPYVDQAFNELVDPDDLGNWTLEDFAQYICCLKENLTEQEFEAIRDQLKEQYQRLLTESRPDDQILVVPTNSLFIEALPAAHSLIEEFKARHRAIDVKKVQAEVREMELENIRRAARVLAGELEDPDIEKKIIVESDSKNVIVSLGDN